MDPNEKPPVDEYPTSPPPPHDSLFPFLSSPSPSASLAVPPPPPAYSALPYRDIEFDFAPILNGKVGDVELETTDGKRFLVHRSVLESETVFFHIYYGFVPAWRLNVTGAAAANLPPNPHLPNPVQPQNALGLSNLIPQIITSLRHITAPPAAQTDNPTSVSPHTTSSPATEPAPIRAPSPPPKQVSAPTPTHSPYTWSVPETSSTLLAFLSLIYPSGFLTPTRQTLLTSPEIVGRVIRAAMGYQSAKALTLSRDRLSAWVHERPVDVYAMASFFKFSDLAILASGHAMKVPQTEWSEEAVKMMGRTAGARLRFLQEKRVAVLKQILEGGMEVDEHTPLCAMQVSMEGMWAERCAALARDIRPESGLGELLETDLTAMGQGQACGQCLLLFGRSVRRSMLAAQELPSTI